MPETIETEKKEEVQEKEPEIIYAGAEAIKFLLAKLKRIKAERNVAVGSLELQLQEIQDELHQKASPFDHMTLVIEEEIKTLMPEIAKTVKTENGAALYRKGSLRVSYDAKALDACNDEHVKFAILPFRKETTVKPSITVEVY